MSEVDDIKVRYMALHDKCNDLKEDNETMKDELDFVYSQIRKHDHTGILKTLFKSRIERRER